MIVFSLPGRALVDAGNLGRRALEAAFRLVELRKSIADHINYNRGEIITTHGLSVVGEDDL